MHLSEVAVATITRVRSSVDERAVRQSLGMLAAFGIPVAVSDRGSPKRFVDWMKRLPSVTVARPGNSLVGQVRASVTAAAKAQRPFILYTEPDKRDFFEGGLAEFVEQASLARSIGIQLAARTELALTTFPPFQRLAETGASELCRRTIGTETDYFYGPFVMRRELARLVASASTDLGWGWRPFLFVTARRLGYRIGAIRGEFECPRDQRREEDRDKEHRLRQFTDNVRGLVYGCLCRMSSRPERISIQCAATSRSRASVPDD